MSELVEQHVCVHSQLSVEVHGVGLGIVVAGNTVAVLVGEVLLHNNFGIDLGFDQRRSGLRDGTIGACRQQCQRALSVAFLQSHDDRWM